MRKAFTLMEINLAIFIMAVGVLSMCSLYTLGYRENRQSLEDVAAASFADAYLAPLIAGLSSMDMSWDDWIQIGSTPSSSEAQEQGVADAVWPRGGWADYVQNVNRGNTSTYKVINSPRGRADEVFGQVAGKVPGDYCGGRPSIDKGYHYALVVTRRGPVVQLAFRVARRREMLMAQPVFVSEVHFHGNPDYGVTTRTEQ